MLWSPIVKPAGQAAKYNQMKDVQEVVHQIKSEFGVDLQLVINETYLNYLQKLREFARTETKALASPVLRLMQIEEKLKKHIRVLERRGAGSNK
jgi:spore maturation protein CgeB